MHRATRAQSRAGPIAAHIDPSSPAQAVPCVGEFNAVATVEERSDAVKLLTMPNGRRPRIRTRSLLRHHTIGKKHTARPHAGPFSRAPRSPRGSAVPGARHCPLSRRAGRLPGSVQPGIRHRPLLGDHVARRHCPPPRQDSTSTHGTRKSRLRATGPTCTACSSFLSRGAAPCFGREAQIHRVHAGGLYLRSALANADPGEAG